MGPAGFWVLFEVEQMTDENCGNGNTDDVDEEQLLEHMRNHPASDGPGVPVPGEAWPDDGEDTVELPAIAMVTDPAGQRVELDTQVIKSQTRTAVVAMDSFGPQVFRALTAYSGLQVTDIHNKAEVAAVAAGHIAVKKLRAAIENQRKEYTGPINAAAKSINAAAKVWLDKVDRVRDELADLRKDTDRKLADEAAEQLAAEKRETQRRLDLLLEVNGGPVDLDQLAAMTPVGFIDHLQSVTEVHNLRLERDRVEKAEQDKAADLLDQQQRLLELQAAGDANTTLEMLALLGRDERAAFVKTTVDNFKRHRDPEPRLAHDSGEGAATPPTVEATLLDAVLAAGAHINEAGDLVGVENDSFREPPGRGADFADALDALVMALADKDRTEAAAVMHVARDVAAAWATLGGDLQRCLERGVPAPVDFAWAIFYTLDGYDFGFRDSSILLMEDEAAADKFIADTLLAHGEIVPTVEGADREGFHMRGHTLSTDPVLTLDEAVDTFHHGLGGMDYFHAYPIHRLPPVAAAGNANAVAE